MQPDRPGIRFRLGRALLALSGASGNYKEALGEFQKEYALASDADAAAIVFKDQPGVEDATSDFPAHLGAGVSCSGKYHRPNAGSGIISQAEGGAGNIDVLARYRTNGYSPVARKLLLGEQAIKSNTVQKGDPIASLKKR